MMVGTSPEVVDVIEFRIMRWERSRNAGGTVLLRRLTKVKPYLDTRGLVGECVEGKEGSYAADTSTRLKSRVRIPSREFICTNNLDYVLILGSPTSSI
jgi:hypothetical protein